MYNTQEKQNIPINVSFWFIEIDCILVSCEKEKEKLNSKSHKLRKYSLNHWKSIIIRRI